MYGGLGRESLKNPRLRLDLLTNSTEKTSIVTWFTNWPLRFSNMRASWAFGDIWDILFVYRQCLGMCLSAFCFLSRKASERLREKKQKRNSKWIKTFSILLINEIPVDAGSGSLTNKKARAMGKTFHISWQINCFLMCNKFSANFLFKCTNLIGLSGRASLAWQNIILNVFFSPALGPALICNSFAPRRMIM